LLPITSSGSSDTTFAIQNMQMRIAKDVNLNWVKDLVSNNEFQKLNDSTWFLKKQNLFVDFMISEKDSTKQMGFFGRKTISYKNIILNQPLKEDIIKLDNNVIVEKGSCPYEGRKTFSYEDYFD